MEANGEYDQQVLARERASLKEWNYLQQSLFTFASQPFHRTLSTQRQQFERYIVQITERKALIREENHTTDSTPGGSRFYEICYRHIRYGSLELTAGYLVSTFMPTIPRNFANLCALILYTGEIEELVQYQLAQLPSLTPLIAQKSLTPREKDVLIGLIRGENEQEMAIRLGIASPTVHTHLQRLYTKLNVCSAQQAVLRAFELRLVDWSGLHLKEEHSIASIE